jgi:hypothetical protein
VNEILLKILSSTDNLFVLLGREDVSVGACSSTYSGSGSTLFGLQLQPVYLNKKFVCFHSCLGSRHDLFLTWFFLHFL